MHLLRPVPDRYSEEWPVGEIVQPAGLGVHEAPSALVCIKYFTLFDQAPEFHVMAQAREFVG